MSFLRSYRLIGLNIAFDRKISALFKGCIEEFKDNLDEQIQKFY
jgi:hypothetical protein